MPFSFENQYARLPDPFFARVEPTPVGEPKWIALNRPLADELGIDVDALDSDEGLSYLSGNSIPEGAEPISMAYAGHQFGGFVPQLGDGRAILLGEVIDKNGCRKDIQLKGSGPTPFSRRGDGRSALGPVIREYLLSEGMAAFGVPTTRALAAVWTGEKVFRERMEPGGIFTRVASSHLRIGTMEYFAARRDLENLKVLINYTLERHYPEVVGNSDEPALDLLDQVSRRQAKLVAKWMSLGFIHGVMNTDNMSLSGETIDYGPCAFLDYFDPEKAFSYIDQHGRYAYGNQHAIAQWNLARLAEAMIPATGDADKSVERAKELLQEFAEHFEEARDREFAAKLGVGEDREICRDLTDGLMTLMDDERADFTITFRRLCSAGDESGESEFLDLFPKNKEIASGWLKKWREHLCVDAAKLKKANPAIIPRNHRVEEAIQAAVKEDFSPFHRMLEALQSPYESREEFAEYELPPTPEEEVKVTFCGT